MNDQEREQRKQRIADAQRGGKPLFVPAKAPSYDKPESDTKPKEPPKVVTSWGTDQKNRSELTNLGSPLSDHPKAR